MIGLVNIIIDRTILVVVFILLFLTLFIMGFFIKGKFEKEKYLDRRINKLFLLKYSILCMLIMSVILIIISYTFYFINMDYGKKLIIGTFAFLIVSVEWALLYFRINIYQGCSKEKIIEQYISILAKDKLSNFRYTEMVTWFSNWNHKCFREKYNGEDDVEKIINRLELILRPRDNGLCLASHHKNEFLNLCLHWKNYSFEEKLIEIESAAMHMANKPSEKYRFFVLSLDHNLLIYLAIIVLHIFACFFANTDNFSSILANILFCLPNDLLLILIYKGIVKEKER